MLENIPKDEDKQIANIVDLTMKRLTARYGVKKLRFLRGVHAKGHGCVTGKFAVLPDVAENLRQGIFPTPGKEYTANVRFSNAAVLVGDDSTSDPPGSPRVHGSRGMAIKLFGVEGDLLPGDNPGRVQDFLMINQPVFAFANVEDYEVLSEVLDADNDNGQGFFKRRLPMPPGTPPTTPAHLRAIESFKIVKRIQSTTLTASAPAFNAFQQPPASPVDNDYFGAAPFMFGNDQVMRFRATCVSRSTADPDLNDANYLRAALAKRMKDKAAGDVVFHFEVQVRDATTLSADDDIENASKEWPASFPFVHVATLTIPLQDVDTPELQELCERSTFTPWRGLAAHKPLGGINRLRRTVYEASAKARAVKT